MPILYACRTSGIDTFTIAKFDADMNVAATYSLTTPGQALGFPTCDCPAGLRPSCRHRNMLPAFLQANAVNSDRFFCYETQSWHQPLATNAAVEFTDRVEATPSPSPTPPTPRPTRRI